MTIKQKQNLLAYLGYYVGNIDGEWGTLSKTATKAFQQDFGLEADGICGPDTEKAMKHAVCYDMPAKKEEETQAPETKPESGTFWDNIRYWSREEFKCQCESYNGPYCDGYPAEPDQTLVELLDDIRAHFGRVAHRSSGLRCPQHNRDSGGVSNSKHLYGKAMDFFIEGVSGEAVRAYADADPRCNYTYVIEGQYVHVDVV